MTQEKLIDTLPVLQLAEVRCSDYNTVKVTKLDHTQSESETTTEQPVRSEHNTTVMKVLQNLGPQTNSETINFLNILKRVEFDEQGTVLYQFCYKSILHFAEQ